MLKKILGTSATRIFNAAANFFLLWLATNYLGSAAWGLSGIILLDISLILLVADMAGNAIVYFTPRRKVSSLLVISMAWSVMVVIALGLIFIVLQSFPDFFSIIVPNGYAVHILVLVLIASFNGFIINILLGKGNILVFNSLFVVQMVAMLLAMSYFIFVLNQRDETAFVGALYVSYLITLLLGIILIINVLRIDSDKEKATLKEMLHFGLMTQLSSITHLLNKRLGFYFIRNISGFGAVGVYHSGTQITEGLRIIGQSIALVQMSAISNSNDKQYAKTLTLQLLKLSVLLTFFGVLMIAFIPSSFFTRFFGKEFGDIKTVFIYLSPGVIALSANAIFSHFFSGTGIPKYNFYASIVGLLVIIPSVILLVPAFGIEGAAGATSLAYLAAVSYQWFVFQSRTQTKLRDLFLNHEDLKFVRLMLQKVKCKRI